MTMEKLLALVTFLQDYSVGTLEKSVKALQSEALRLAADSIRQNELELNLHEKNLVGDGSNKIPAIKAYRLRTNAGLLEAKNKVEQYMQKKLGYTNYPR